MSRGLAVFDIDGTLTQTNDVDNECYLRAIRDVLGIDITPDWTDAPHVTDAALTSWICERYGGRSIRDDESSAVLARLLLYLEVALRDQPHRFSPIPGAPDVFSRLSQHGWESVMATGAWSASAHLKLRAIGLDPERTPHATSSDAHTRVEILEIAVGRAAPRHTRIVSIGDGTWDVETARRLGWPFIGIGTGTRASRLKAAGATLVLPDLAETGTLVQALEAAKVPE